VRVPAGAGPSGKRLWKGVVDEFVLAEHELALLRELVRVVDRLDVLHDLLERDGLVVAGRYGPRAHPAAIEARQLALVQARLTATLRIPLDGEASDSKHAPPRLQRRGAARGPYLVGGSS
jgi:hypothetical protein